MKQLIFIVLTIFIVVICNLNVVESKSSMYYSMIGDYEKGVDYYKVLNVSKESTSKEIKQSFRKLSLKHHPDRNPDKSSHDFYMMLNQAHSVLMDKETRDEYNELLAYGIPMYDQYYGKYAYRYTGIQHDIRHVLIGLVIIVTVAKYFYQLNKHNRLIQRAKSTPQYQARLAQFHGDEDEIQLVVKGAEKPDIKSLFVLQILFFYPYALASGLFKFVFINKFKFTVLTEEELDEARRIENGYTKEDWEYEKKKQLQRMENFKKGGRYKQYLRSKNK